MGRVVCDVGVSADGFVAGPAQSPEHPLGVGGEQLHRWMFERAAEHGEELAAITSASAFIMGRNMFGPVRGPWESWPHGAWDGWWGPVPPYRAPVLVLTHFPRQTLVLDRTEFRFHTDGLESALELASDLAGDGDVAIAGGAETINRSLAIGAIEELRLHIAPIVLGDGERLFQGVGELELEPTGSRATELVTHVTYRVG
jgi:dihydrofolate reductase